MKKRGNTVRWIIPQPKQDQEIRAFSESPDFGSVFNIPLAENDGGIAVIEPSCKLLTSSGHHEADDDIRAGRIKRFDDPDDMIASLKQPWQD